jgi:hypothetical protein
MLKASSPFSKYLKNQINYLNQDQFLLQIIFSLFFEISLRFNVN